MSTNKKLVFSLLFAATAAFLPSHYTSADEGRYFVKTTKTFWKNALGVRHSFDNGFTTDLSEFQVRFNRMLGLEIEPVKILQILPEEKVAAVPDEPKTEAPTSKGGKARVVPSDQTPWGIEVLYRDSALAKTTGGADVTVAVLDTGVAVTHPDLKRRIAQCKDFTNFKFPVIDGKCDDKNGHGTHVAGIIAADGGTDEKGIYGVAPAAQLLVYKVCGPSGLCYSDDIAIALRTAADQGAQVVNLSLGSDTESGLIRDAINYAVSKNVLPVAAAGNDGPFDDSIDYPAANAAVIAVGALNQALQVTEWSSRGINTSTTPWVVEEKDIELTTPGENIESTYNNGGYAILSGTSMASPFVAGLAAKYWQTTASASAQATRDFIHILATDLLPTGDDNASGFGLPRVTSTP